MLNSLMLLWFYSKDTRLKLEDLEAVARKAEIQGCEVCSAENKLQFFFPDILALHFFSYYAHLNGATFVQWNCTGTDHLV